MLATKLFNGLFFILLSYTLVSTKPQDNKHKHLEDEKAKKNKEEDAIKEESVDRGLYSRNQIDNSKGLIDLDMKIKLPFNRVNNNNNNKNQRKRRAVIKAEHHKWKNAIVPYQFDTDQPVANHVKTMVFTSFEHISNQTCVKFVQRTDENDYINIAETQNRCWSYVGRIGGNQTLNLGSNCFTLSVIVHELLHALGFLHEHNRPDRDDYVTVNFDNIQDGAEAAFKKFSLFQYGGVSLSDISYDKQSVMHYHRLAFTKFSQSPSLRLQKEYMTIYSKDDFNEVLGNEAGLSFSDIFRINKRYSCPSKSDIETTTVQPVMIKTTTLATVVTTEVKTPTETPTPTTLVDVKTDSTVAKTKNPVIVETTKGFSEVTKIPTTTAIPTTTEITTTTTITTSTAIPTTTTITTSTAIPTTTAITTTITIPTTTAIPMTTATTTTCKPKRKRNIFWLIYNRLMKQRRKKKNRYWWWWNKDRKRRRRKYGRR